MHVPWYNSYHSHHGEGDAIRESLEDLLFQYGVDLIFTGHVHSYERSRRVLGGQPNPCGPIHVTIGDGGNREGAAIGWEEPQPEWSEVSSQTYDDAQIVHDACMKHILHSDCAPRLLHLFNGWPAEPQISSGQARAGPA